MAPWRLARCVCTQSSSLPGCTLDVCGNLLLVGWTFSDLISAALLVPEAAGINLICLSDLVKDITLSPWSAVRRGSNREY